MMASKIVTVVEIRRWPIFQFHCSHTHLDRYVRHISHYRRFKLHAALNLIVQSWGKAGDWGKMGGGGELTHNFHPQTSRANAPMSSQSISPPSQNGGITHFCGIDHLFTRFLQRQIPTRSVPLPKCVREACHALPQWGRGWVEGRGRILPACRPTAWPSQYTSPALRRPMLLYNAHLHCMVT